MLLEELKDNADKTTVRERLISMLLYNASIEEAIVCFVRDEIFRAYAEHIDQERVEEITYNLQLPVEKNLVEEVQ